MRLRITLDEDDLCQIVAAHIRAVHGVAIPPGDLTFTCEGFMEDTNHPRALKLLAEADQFVDLEQF